MAMQRGNAENEVWDLERRSAFYVLHSTGTCYRVRIRWSNKLGLELPVDIYSSAHAQRVVDRIHARGCIEVARWYRVFFPSRTKSWSGLSGRSVPRTQPLVIR